MTPADEQELRRFIASQAKLIQQLTARLEVVIQIEGPDAVTRRRMLELAGTVFAEGATPIAKAYAGTLLADLVRKSIPAPRPVEVPSPVVSVEKENKAC